MIPSQATTKLRENICQRFLLFRKKIHFILVLLLFAITAQAISLESKSPKENRSKALDQKRIYVWHCKQKNLIINLHHLNTPRLCSFIQQWKMMRPCWFFHILNVLSKDFIMVKQHEAKWCLFIKFFWVITSCQSSFTLIYYTQSIFTY